MKRIIATLVAVLVIGMSVPAVTFAHGSSSDKTPPKLTALSIKSSGADPARATTGDVVTISLTANEKVTPVVLVESRTLFARATNTGGNSWSNTYTVGARDPQGKIDYIVTLTDTSGNIFLCTSVKLPFQIIPRCTTTDGTSVTVSRETTPPPPADTQAPVIATHADVAAVGPLAGAVVAYTNPTATDNVDSSVVVSCTPASGTLFAVGTTSVSCNAHDTAGNNAATTTFNVVVTLPPPVLTYEFWPTPNAIGASLSVNTLNSLSSNSLIILTAATTTRISSVCLAIDSYDATDTNLKLGIYNMADTSNVGGLIGYSDVHPFTGNTVDWYSAGDVTCFTFSSPVTVTAGSQYAVTVDRLLNSSTSQDIIWYNQLNANDSTHFMATSISLPGPIVSSTHKTYIRMYGNQ